MSTTIERAGETAGAPPVPTIGGAPVVLERPSGRKGSRALAILKALSKATPELQQAAAKFRVDYERDNFVELDRAQARLAFPPRPISDDDGEVLYDDAGEVRMYPSPIDGMTEEDWTTSGNVLRRPVSPTQQETIAAVFGLALELAEEHVIRLLALFTISNEDVTAHWRAGDLSTVLDERADWILDASYADEVLELAVACGELVDRTFRRKAEELGDRLGNALRLFGLNPSRPTTPEPDPSPTPESPDGPSTSRPTSSTDSPAPTDGQPTPPSTPPSTSSPSSPNGSTATTPPDVNPPETE